MLTPCDILRVPCKNRAYKFLSYLDNIKILAGFVISVKKLGLKFQTYIANTWTLQWIEKPNILKENLVNDTGWS